MRRQRFGMQPRWLVWIICLWACIGCAQLKKSFSAKSHSAEVKQARGVETNTTLNEELPFFHKVRWRGETLSLIAEWYTGDRRNRKALAEVNPWANPSNMFSGLKVKIPRELLKTQKPMPREFILSSGTKGRAHSPAAQEDQDKDARKASPEKTGTKTSYMEFVVP